MLPASRSFRNSELGVDYVPKNGEHLDLQNVWDSNLEEEMDRLMKASEMYPIHCYGMILLKSVILQDTEFPGVCYPGSDESANIFEYSILKNNVDKLKIIQLGITLCTPMVGLLRTIPTWQFNFQFDPE